jgi:hypothetical protein
MSDLYQDDIVSWSERQAQLLRQHAAVARVNDAIDWPNIIEEIEAVGGSERAALASHIGTVIEHLLKLQASPAKEPRSGWRETVIRTRSAIAGQLEDSPSLRAKVDSMVARQLSRQRRLVADVLALYDEAPLVPLEGIVFSVDQVLGSWFPAD